MSRKRPKAKAQQSAGPSRSRPLLHWLLAFALGAAIAAGAAMLIAQATGREIQPAAPPQSSGTPGRRAVAQLIALSDPELERADIVEMNVAVAREIPGLEDLDYDRYRRIVDAWTDQFRAWLPTVEHAFRQAPGRYHDDISLFRLGMLAQFLDQSVGVAYVEAHRRAQVEARKTGRKAEVLYTDPGHLLLHGLIDTQRGTCGTMPCSRLRARRRALRARPSRFASRCSSAAANRFSAR